MEGNVCSNCRKILYSPVPYCPFCGLAQDLHVEGGIDSVSARLSTPQPQAKTAVPGDSTENSGVSEAPVVSPAHPIETPSEYSTEEPEKFEPETSPTTEQPTPTAAGGSDTTPPPQTDPHHLPNTSAHPTKNSSDWKKILGGGIGKILLVFGITAAVISMAFLSLSGGPDPETSEQTQPNPENILDPDFVREFLAKSPDKYDALHTARRLDKAGRMDKAFLIYRYAERLGVGEASTTIAQLYDPTFSGRMKSPLNPNARKALELYRKGADQGDPAASEGLSRLVNWLNQQEKSGGAKAREHLDSLE